MRLISRAARREHARRLHLIQREVQQALAAYLERLPVMDWQEVHQRRARIADTIAEARVAAQLEPPSELRAACLTTIDALGDADSDHLDALDEAWLAANKAYVDKHFLGRIADNLR